MTRSSKRSCNAAWDYRTIQSDHTPELSYLRLAFFDKPIRAHLEL